MTTRPKWVLEYADAGLPSNWADPVLEKYDSDVIDSAGSKLSPLQFTDIDFNNITQESVGTVPQIDEYQLPYRLLLVLDVVCEFADNLPNSDKGIYSVYQNIMAYTDSTDIPFPDFYRFCRQLQYNNIRQTELYLRINDYFEQHNNDLTPDSDEIWYVQTNGEEYKVQVQNRIVDDKQTKIYCQIVKPESSSANTYDIGEFVELPAKEFTHPDG